MGRLMITARKYALALTALVAVAWSSFFVIDQLVIPGSTGLDLQAGLHSGVILASTAVVIMIVRRFRSTLSMTIGSHMATLLTFFMVLITFIGALFAFLDAFHVPGDNLLLGW